jgi:hypothetical protein
MEIIDKLIFQASRRGLDIVRLLELYTLASSRLARMLRDRQALDAEDTDLERLIDAALDYVEGLDYVKGLDDVEGLDDAEGRGRVEE